MCSYPRSKYLGKGTEILPIFFVKFLFSQDCCTCTIIKRNILHISISIALQKEWMQIVSLHFICSRTQPKLYCKTIQFTSLMPKIALQLFSYFGYSLLCMFIVCILLQLWISVLINIITNKNQWKLIYQQSRFCCITVYAEWSHICCKPSTGHDIQYNNALSHLRHHQDFLTHLSLGHWSDKMIKLHNYTILQMSHLSTLLYGDMWRVLLNNFICPP